MIGGSKGGKCSLPRHNLSCSFTTYWGCFKSWTLQESQPQTSALADPIISKAFNHQLSNSPPFSNQSSTHPMSWLISRAGHWIWSFCTHAALDSDKGRIWLQCYLLSGPVILSMLEFQSSSNLLSPDLNVSNFLLSQGFCFALSVPIDFKCELLEWHP